VRILTAAINFDNFIGYELFRGINLESISFNLDIGKFIYKMNYICLSLIISN